MNGYIYDPSNRVIVMKIPNATKCSTSKIKGDITAKLGTGQYLITDQDFAEGSILPDIPDRRNELEPLVE